MKIVISHLLVTTRDIHEDRNFSLIGIFKQVSKCTFSEIVDTYMKGMTII
jgi:hypothetical protein